MKPKERKEAIALIDRMYDAFRVHFDSIGNKSALSQCLALIEKEEKEYRSSCLDFGRPAVNKVSVANTAKYLLVRDLIHYGYQNAAAPRLENFFNSKLSRYASFGLCELGRLRLNSIWFGQFWDPLLNDIEQFNKLDYSDLVWQSI